jgi:hypothetical protein
MIAIKPDLGDIRIMLILRDFTGREMAVIIDNREILGIGMVQRFGSSSGQKKIVCDEVLHGTTPFYPKCGFIVAQTWHKCKIFANIRIFFCNRHIQKQKFMLQ